MSTVPIIKIISLTIVWSAVASTVIAFIYGVLSWCLIKKFRNFRNYLLLSAISASLLKLLTLQIQLHANDLVKHIQDSIDFDLVYAILLFFSLSFHCWLIVLAYMFYADYTKLFDLDIKKKYLKTILFCWCIPILETVLFFLGMAFLSRDLFLYVTMLTLMLIPLLISLIIYVVVVYLVFRGGKSEMWSSTKKWGRFVISTLIFVIGNWFVITNLFKLTRANLVVFYFVGEMEEYLLHVLISIFIIFVKSNRSMWGEFMNKKQEPNSLDMN